MVGLTFGKLTVTAYSHTDSRRRKFYTCSCSCGNTRTVQGSVLTNGGTKSCGCSRKGPRPSKGTAKDTKSVEDIEAALVRDIYHSYKYSAKVRNIVFNLSYPEFCALIKQSCTYCGSAPSNRKRVKRHDVEVYYSGIDRIDSTGGYTTDNVCPCCVLCNYSKLEKSTATYIEWLHKSHTYLTNKGVITGEGTIDLTLL